MKTRFQKTNKLLIALAMIVNLSTTAFSQIAVSDSSISKALSCDASFKDMLPLILLPANTDMTNLVALGPVDQNNYNKKYFWDLGDGTLDTGMLITHNYANPGGYFVTLRTVKHIIGITYSHNVVCSHKQWVTVGNEIPRLCDASFRPKIFITHDYPSSGSGLVGYEAINKNHKSYHWDFGDGTKDTGRSVSHHFVNEGKYLVSLTVKDENCEDTKTMWMTKRGYYFPIDSTARCNAEILQSVNKQTVTLLDQNQFVTLVADGNYETRTWDFGDGFTAEGNNVTHTYAKAGKYMATLTKSSYYNPCFGNPACFAAPVLKCTQTYQVEVVIDERVLNCKAELSHTVTDKTLEIRDNILYVHNTFELNTKYERRHWDFGDGSDTVSNNFVTHTYASAGKYRVRLIKSLLNDPCPFIHYTLPRCLAMPFLICTDTTYLDIEVGNVYPTCKAKLGYTINDKTIEVMDSLLHMSKYGSIIDPITEYRSWDFGDGSNSGLNTRNPNVKVSHTYANAGKYRIRLIKSLVKDPCPFIHDTLPRCKALALPICMDTTYLDVEIGNRYFTCDAKLEYVITENTLEIKDNNVLSTRGGFREYRRWNFGDEIGDTLSNDLITHSYAKAGKYSIRLIKSIIKFAVPDTNDTFIQLGLPIVHCTDTTYLDIEIGNSIIASIYPNPASDYMTISVKNNFNKMDLRLYDQTGKLKKEVFEILTDTKEIDTNGLENGLYFYTLSDGENVVLKGKIAVSK